MEMKILKIIIHVLKNIINYLLIILLNHCLEENIISGLSFYLLRIIMNAIQFSSNDLQDSLELLLSNLLDKFDSITNIIINNKSKMNNE